ncbi:MAG: 1-acyl-sn-glycerol-3-phosphate acyltransferase [Deltaproteobacteria bacterium]|nr:1-acyl-sn-glycerol-3-phosphate acyltransferase [Deltaproteobacteria bacterium]
MAERSKPKGKAAAPPARSVLGNDPFQRGAAPTAPTPNPIAQRPEPVRVQRFDGDDARPVTKSERPPKAARAKPAPKAEAKPEPKQKPQARPPSKASEARPKSASTKARPTTAPSMRAAEKAKAETTARPATVSARPNARPARPKTDSMPAVEPKAARPRTDPMPATEPKPARPASRPVPVVEPEIETESESDRDQAMVRHVHVPEVETEPEPESEPPPHDEPRPKREGGPMAALAELAMRQAQGLLGAVASSPTALEAAAAAISGTTAVRALMARPEGPKTVDDFGEDGALVARTAPTLDFLYRHYFRVSVEGQENLPRHGPLMAIANHAGALPLDGPIVRSALERSRAATRARWLVEDALFHAPFLGTWLNRLGAVRACPENAQRLLEGGAALVVFPEGVTGLTKTYRRRYQLQRFGRGGFVKLALRTGAPLVPTAVLGGEETAPVLATFSAPSLGLPVVPVTPSIVPLPAKWTVVFLKPIDLSKYGPADAGDLALVQRVTEEVRTAIATELERLRGSRQSVFRG